MWRFPVLVALGGLLIFGLIIMISSSLRLWANRKAMQAAIDAACSRRDNIWKEAESVGDMVSLYMMMVAKHGPKSEEAKAFRFGTDSQLMKELHGDDEAMQAFEQQADIIDETYRRIRTECSYHHWQRWRGYVFLTVGIGKN